MKPQGSRKPPKPRLPLVGADGEVRELDPDDVAEFRAAKDVLPPKLYGELLAMNRRAGVRGPQKAPTKERITIRLSPDVVSSFRASGPGSEISRRWGDQASGTHAPRPSLPWHQKDRHALRSRPMALHSPR